MHWNPEIPTQFLVANDDDQNPSLNIWDLRNPDYPVATFSDIHYNGILSASWCLTDPSLVVSSSREVKRLVLGSEVAAGVYELRLVSKEGKSFSQTVFIQ